MSSDPFLFEVHFGGKFNQQLGCNYVGGDVAVYDEPYDRDYFSFFEMEAIVRPYGYNTGDLLYYKEPGKSLVEGLKLVSSDLDVLQMVKCHEAEQVVVLYLVSFDGIGGDEDNDEAEGEDNEEAERRRIGVNDRFWSTHSAESSGVDEGYEVDDIDEAGESGEESEDEGENGEGNEDEELLCDTEKGKQPMGDKDEQKKGTSAMQQMDSQPQVSATVEGNESQLTVTTAPPESETYVNSTLQPMVEEVATKISASEPASGSSKGTDKAVRGTASQPIGGIASRVRAHQLERKWSARLKSQVGIGEPQRMLVILDLTQPQDHQPTLGGVKVAWEDQDLKEHVWCISDLIPVSP
ncbi:hypothetical protein CJ030_MR6G007216 [Morella rubra]|uniref:PB1-like domain-containing protein n=1 Tax=Morella rubra TaxID=262757 RepID=A0A6A1V8X0_9ROSI|nr:hypothetical protein CJ030_MR6G007216 [Morella rubra]